MADSIKYSVYPQKQRTPFMLIIAGALVITTILAMVFWDRHPVMKEDTFPHVAPMVPNPTSVPAPH